MNTTSTTASPEAVRSTFKVGTVTEQPIHYGGVDLPPIVSGVMLDTDFKGNSCERHVKTMAVKREQIDSLLSAVASAHVELAPAMSVVQEFLLHMDGIRDHAKLGALSVEGWLLEDQPNVDAALKSLRTITAMLGRWRDTHHLYLN